jgi:hypothetical protein
MSAESEQFSGERERSSRPASRGSDATPPGDSPDLLRWRADLLLDEMMLGAVDVSAAGSDALATPSSVRPAQPSRNGAGEDAAPATDAAHGTNERLYSLEQRYDAFRRSLASDPQAPSLSESPRPESPRPGPAPHADGAKPAGPVPPPSPAASPAAASGASAAPSQPAAPAPDVETRWASAPEKWEWQDFGGNADQPPAAGAVAPNDAAAPAAAFAAGAADAAVRQDPAQYVSTMSVMSSSRKRSNLLPRMSTLDVDALNQEIAMLHSEIGALLPVGNEASERARHLLDKAYGILQSDPMRSAEVEYYMQQVRTIVDRMRQARHWSDLYRRRLRMYLMGWLLLATVLLVARYVFPLDIEALIAALAGASFDSLVVQNATTLAAAIAAGALGGAAGALYTMAQHTRSEHNLFDRKYGLRGLTLPIIPVFVAIVACLIFGAFYAVLGINPALNLIAGMLPAVAALAYGLGQETLYGTRD